MSAAHSSWPTTFVPLPNFMPGDDRNRNTCFIAAIVNLRGVVPGIADRLSLSTSTWPQVIQKARTLWDCRYQFDMSHRGQHDAAEFLFDVLSGNASIGFSVARRTTAHTCMHSWATSLSEMFLVLDLPEASLRPGILKCNRL